MSPIELQAVYQLGIATFLGAVLGLERSIAGKRAGMRTYALVAMGACLMTTTSLIVSNSYIGLTSFDPLRVAAAIVMGIGFIGTGVVVFKGNNLIGLTTAAGLWVAAGLGIAVGFRLYTVAVAAAVLTLVIFWLFIGVENAVEKLFGRQPREDVRIEAE
jgi:putative Mg2+ transporter-C (MgtC) family protein